MVFDNVTIGDRFVDKSRKHIITIVEITPRGAKYSCPPYHLLPARYGPSLVTEGELFFSDPNVYCNWDDWYEKVNENEPEPATVGSVNVTTTTQVALSLGADGNYREPSIDTLCPLCHGTGLRKNPTPNCS